MENQFSGTHPVGNPTSAAISYDRFRNFLIAKTGISLSDNKHYLVESRLKNILTDNGLPSVDVLLSFIESHPGTQLLDKVVDAMTTNETFWFRDTYLYDYIENTLLPSLVEKNSADKVIDVWSAASSTGQEAYSFSISVEQYIKHLKLNGKPSPVVNVLGTDISKQVIDLAKAGIYSPSELSRGLPEELKRQYFDTLPNGSSRIKEIVRQRVRFRHHNLLDNFSSVGSFDIVMCRNVLIYFDDKTTESILRRIHGALRKNGVLFLSSAEGICGLSDLYAMESIPAGIMYRAIK